MGMWRSLVGDSQRVYENHQAERAKAEGARIAAWKGLVADVEARKGAQSMASLGSVTRRVYLGSSQEVKATNPVFDTLATEGDALAEVQRWLDGCPALEVMYWRPLALALREVVVEAKALRAKDCGRDASLYYEEITRSFTDG